MIKHCLLLTLSLISFSLAARETIYKGAEANKKIAGTSMIRYTDLSQVPNYIQFDTNSTIELLSLQSWMNQHLGISNEYDLIQLDNTSDQIGMQHIRYRQSYKGVPIQGTMYIAHTRNGYIESLSGVIYNDIPALNIQPVLSEAASLQIALNKINAIQYKWQIAEEELAIKEEEQNSNATYYPKAVNYILKSKGKYHVCYAFNIYAHEPMGRTMEYIDAISGEIILSKNLIEHINANGTAVTKYSGTKPFQTDSTAPTNFRLRDASRGLGVRTFNMLTGTTTGGSVDFTDADNYWNNVNAAKDEAATDAHWGAQKTYDYLFNKHGRNSIDNAGFQLNSYVHYGVDYANAFWNGTRMTYGDGDVSVGFLVMTGLDVCGHEIGHGLVNYSADLSATSSGTDECDALNEAYGDIIGTAVEKYARPTQWDWKIGGDITCNSSGTPNGVGLRSMSNPLSFNDPNCYLGTNWSSAGEPHANAGPLDYWFYLINVGNVPSNIAALGMDTSDNIAYRALTVHLFPNADYADARFYTILASTELYGACSTPTIATTNAWNKVCVGAAYVATPTVSNFTADILQTCNTTLTVNFTNTSISGNTYTWHFGDGTTSTITNPSHTYTSGIYNVKLVVNGGTCGNDSLTQTAYIQVGPPPGPATIGANICLPTTAILNATPNIAGDTIRWFATATGGTSLATGVNFTTPVTSTTTTYYAEEKITAPSYNIGPLNNSIGSGGNYTNTTRFLIFNCTAPTILKSVWVFAQGAGNRTIIIKNSAGTTLQSVTVNIPNGGSVVNLNMPIPVGNNMQIGFATGSTVNIYRNSTGATYPYTNGPITITGNTAAGSASYYYFFYDWVVKGDDCFSMRTPATVVFSGGGGPTPATITPSGSLNVCSPNTVLLNANTGVGLSYQWYNGTTLLSGATGSNYNASVSGNYSVVVTSSSGCLTPGTSSAASVVIDAAPPATITPAGPTTFCQGSNVLLNANSGSGLSYQWSMNGSAVSAATSASYSANQTGNYSVLVTNTTGCFASSSMTSVTVNPLPISNVTPTGSVSICQGNSITLSASSVAGSQYQWYLNSTIISGATSSNYAANQAGDFSVQITNSSNCSATSAMTSITVNPLPSASVTASGITTFCQGGSVTLNANTGAGLSYQWFLNTMPITGATSANYVASQSGNYSVQVVNSNNCSASSNIITVTVTVAPTATITPAGAASFCTGSSIVLNANTGVGLTYQWYLNGNIIVGATSSNYTASQAGNFTVEVSNSNCATTSSATIVTINPLPLANITAASSTSICQGSSVILNANTGVGYTYQWYLNGNLITGATTASYLASMAGIYDAMVTSNNCTSSSNPITVTVIPSPVPVIVVTGNLLSVSGGTFTTYQWYLNGVLISGATNSTYTATQNGSYTVEVSQNGCKGISVAINLTGVGVNDIDNDLITISPNPTTDKIQIEGVIPYKIYVRNLQGQIIKVVYNKTSISFTDVAIGMYMIQLFDKENVMLLNEKIIKQ